MLLSRDDLLAIRLPIRDVDISDLLGEDEPRLVHVQALSGTNRDAYEKSLLKVGARGGITADLTNQRARLASLVIVDDEGNRMFRSADVDALGKLPAAVLDRITETATEMSGIGADAVDDAAGNSDAA